MNDSQISPPKQPRLAIADVSSWVLRGGLVVSLTVMLVGILFSFVHGTVSVESMTTDPFDYRPAHIWQGICQGHGKSIIEAGNLSPPFHPDHARRRLVRSSSPFKSATGFTPSSLRSS